jgi:predicted small lipoprotein YifL
MRQLFRVAFIVVLSASALASCGSKGPLVLTPEQKQEQEAKQKKDQTPPPLESDKSNQGGSNQPH